MKKIYFILLIFFYFLNNSYSQKPFLDWINLDQSYVKITTNTKGIYKITKSDLDSLGASFSNADPRTFQVWHRGQQIDIIVTGQEDGIFDPGDLIQFYGQENDGANDIEMYDAGANRPHPYSSLYSNETAYFLTSGVNFGNRVAEIPYMPNIDTPTGYYKEEILNVYTNEWLYNPNRVSAIIPQSRFQNDEGLVSVGFHNRITSPVPLNTSVSLTSYLQNTGKDVLFEMKIANRSPYVSSISYTIAGQTGSTSINPVFSLNASATISLNLSNYAGTSMQIFANNQQSATANYWGAYYYKITYPASFNNNFNKVYKLYSGAENTIIQFTNDANNLVFDISDKNHIKKYAFELDGALQRYNILGTTSERSLWVANQLRRPKKLSLVTFENINQTTYDYLIITDARTIAGATRYKAYRETNMGGNYKVYVAETQNLYNQFSYGERNPIALKRFLEFMTAQISVKNLFLLGQSVSIPNQLKTKELANLPSDDYVPTYGYPGADALFSVGINGANSISPTIPTGRLVINSDLEIDQYLAKVKMHDARNNSNWQSNILPITGPKTSEEFTSFNNTMNDALSFATNGSFNSNVYPIMSTISTNGIGISDQSLYDNVNNGVGILTYFGHGNTTSTNYNFGLVSTQTITGGVAVGGPIRYQNANLNTLLIAIACDVGDSFKGTSSNKTNNSLISDWVSHPTLGALNGIAHSYFGWDFVSGPYLKDLFSTIFENQSLYYGTIGDIWKAANIKFSENSSVNTTGNHFSAIQEQTNLIGDPANRIFYQKCNALANVETNTSGSWENTNTWTCGLLPDVIDNVTILPGHIVSLPSNASATIGNIKIDGKLLIETNATLNLVTPN